MYIELKILNKEFYEEYGIPKPATDGSAAIDLYCTENIDLYRGETALVSTGLAMWLGSNNIGYRAMSFMKNAPIAGIILPRSGLGHRGLILGNSVGLIDEDYQGEIKLSLLSRAPAMELKKGDRIAQMMFVPICQPQFQVVEEFSNTTNRATGGFGSTDTK